MTNRWLNVQCENFEQFFSCYLNQLDTAERLKAAIMHSALNGGKRLRPLLVLAAGKISQAPLTSLYAIGSAIELIHCYSLVHDDLPAMDNDELRRGKPSCHIAFDEATAILTGDGLLTESFTLLSSIDELSATLKIDLIKILAHNAGLNGMVQGQMMDMLYEMQPVSLETLKKIHQLKTGALIKASVEMGYRAGPLFDETNAKLLISFAENIGLAFQIQDDVLDISATTATLGKTAGKDQKYEKATYVSFLGLEQAQQMARDLIDEALLMLNTIGTAADTLAGLAKLIIERKY